MTAPVPLGSPLLPAELQVLELVAEDLTNVAIARRLSMAESTVKAHLRRALVKLGAFDRWQAVAFAYRRGWLAVPVPAVSVPAVLPDAAAAPAPVVRPGADAAVTEAWAVVESVAIGRPSSALRAQATRALVAAGRRVPVRRAS